MKVKDVLGSIGVGDVFRGLVDLASGRKAARSKARRAEMEAQGVKPADEKSWTDMDASEIWRTGLGNSLAGASGDLFRKTRRGQMAGKAGEWIADRIVKPIRQTPGLKFGESALPIIQKGKEGLKETVAQARDAFNAADAAVPSMAKGGFVKAPKYRGRLVRVHDGELIVPAKKAKGVFKQMKKRMRK
jgi:hypothetical protein